MIDIVTMCVPTRLQPLRHRCAAAIARSSSCGEHHPANVGRDQLRGDLGAHPLRRRNCRTHTSRDVVRRVKTAIGPPFEHTQRVQRQDQMRIRVGGAGIEATVDGFPIRRIEPRQALD